MPDINHFSDSEESFHSFDDNEPSPPVSPRRPSPSQASDQTGTQIPPTESKCNRRRTSSSTKKTTPARPPVERFPPAEEAALLSTSNTLKTTANSLFGTASYQNAIQTYDKALASCPNYLDYELAVLRSNIAACHLKLEEWQDCVDSATKGLEGLERLEPLPKPAKKPKSSAAETSQQQTLSLEDNDQPIIEEVTDDLEARIAHLQTTGHTLPQVRNLQIKLLTRRAKAHVQLASWASLQAADEDYATLLDPTMQASLSPTDKRHVLDSARALTPLLKAAQDREVGEMMGKLKGLGNSLLGNFGLSTDNFQFVKDEKTGGYSMNFDQNAGKK
ncbi:hypothetical protein LTR91_006099 [Friedmanniomyces endolithicus]|uniref:Tetratricopeptide repeat protein 1 n=1 Tax=Friedmanniomyces endolithicus TaxID=329885 RepID=A0A4U0UJP0_9PEZI|nr:hypothetical protein LTS09_006072 [Friedmanniomyces endolithicus]KAK0277468.1 hypothetical protein LTR35_009870 [Friedmanniomyces endolithicus]KAK0283200.1 hypothetical protein LTS00_011804 [Friedmanniomyces endolithicus]KAK0311222.1 hypothetical protein LTR01_003217 [Friedmanniomyces endolithicus]KAK0320044.1 hypothetical protein LTR82_008979 [Friedmanniomyces endolithicus]